MVEPYVVVAPVNLVGHDVVLVDVDDEDASEAYDVEVVFYVVVVHLICHDDLVTLDADVVVEVVVEVVVVDVVLLCLLFP